MMANRHKTVIIIVTARYKANTHWIHEVCNHHQIITGRLCCQYTQLEETKKIHFKKDDTKEIQQYKQQFSSNDYIVKIFTTTYERLCSFVTRMMPIID